VIGGGAQKASDKVFQFNGAGKLTITGFHVEDFGKLARSCGHCKTRVRRTIVLSDLDVTAPGKDAGRHRLQLRRHGDAVEDPCHRRHQEEAHDLRALQGQQQRQGARRARYRRGWNLLQVHVI
jgi:hypothetical protein